MSAMIEPWEALSQAAVADPPLRRLFELEDFEPKEAVERFREIGMGGKEG